MLAASTIHQQEACDSLCVHTRLVTSCYCSPEVLDATSLSYSTRVKWFLICFAGGILCSILVSVIAFYFEKTILWQFYDVSEVVLTLGNRVCRSLLILLVMAQVGVSCYLR